MEHYDFNTLHQRSFQVVQNLLYLVDYQQEQISQFNDQIESSLSDYQRQR